ncbi:MBL fold metallo-hydrolase [Bacillus timonensis]|nr:MBL fold metallo-hydrolase [Bacillus timonensis]
MRVRQYEHLYQLTFLPNTFPVNCYLLEEGNELTLIDAALPYSHKPIISFAEKLEKPITKIVITHAHDDHLGALDVIKQTYPNAIVYISKRDKKLLKGDKSLEQHEPQTSIKGGVPKKVKTVPDILLEEGDEVGSLVAYSSPGHTPGSMSFFDKRTRALVVGDALQTRGGVAVAGKMKWSFPFPALATWNRQVALESAIKLKELSPTLLAVGHGNVIVNPINQMDIAIREAEREFVR